MADFGGGDPEAFRKEVREWVDDNFPAELKGRPNPMMREERSQPSQAQEAWRKAVGAKGWAPRPGSASTAAAALGRLRPGSSSRNSAAPGPTTPSAAWA